MELVDLLVMEVPSNVLKHAIKESGLDEGTKLTVIEDMARSISQGKPDIGQRLAQEFRFAGTTAVNVHQMMKGIPADWHNKSFFKRHLVTKYGEDILREGIRPELTSKPTLIRAYDLGEKLVLAFSFLGQARRYFEDYQVVVRQPQVLEYVVIHFSPFAVEVRSGQSQNEMFKIAVLDIMDINKDDVVWDKVTKLNDEQAIQLASKLKARLRTAKHKMIEGPYATKEVTANPLVRDLASTEEYIREFGNQPMKKKTLVFDYRYSFGYEDEISYVITDEGLWFRTHVGEQVIMYVLNAIIHIKYDSDTPDQEADVEDLSDEQDYVIEG